MVDFYLIVTALAVIANILLGILVFARNRKDIINVSFFVMTSFVVLWLLFNYLVDLPANPSLVLLFLQLTEAFGAWAVYSFLFFVSVFPKKEKGNSFTLVKYYVILPIIFTPLIFTNFVISGIEKVSGVNTPILGLLGNIFLIFYLPLTVLLSLIFLVYKLRKSAGANRVQLKLVTFGFGLTTILALLSSVIIPVFTGSAELARFSALATVFFIGFTTYAIVKHRLMDIRMVVARSVAYVILIASLAAIYAGSVMGLERIFFPDQTANINLGQTALRTVISVIMVFLFQPLRKWINNVTDKIFFKSQYNQDQLLNDLSHTISSTIVLIEMLYKVNDLLMSNMKLSRVAFVIFKNEDEPYTSQAIGYKGWPPVNVPDFRHMVKKGILIYDELEDNSIYKKMLKKYDASIIVPIRAEGLLIGVFLAGEKNSGDMFTQQDIQVLEIMAPEVAVGIDNAKAYEEISKFNVTLREEVKRATRKLKEKNEELRDLDKAKDEFISMASHQLRTPLTAIKGYLSMLLEGDAGEIKVSQYDFINEAYSAAGRMVGLINDLLNVSRMETGRFFLEPKEVDIERIVQEEVKQLENHAREKGLYLKIEEKGKVPHIWADETKIRQVVMNFIDNAIYYTQKGGVTVKLSKDSKNFIFEVIDTGIGVPKAQQEHLFEKFFRADNARTTRPDGTGLGIYLAKRVTEDHGGKVLFHSEEGKGSTFGFTFPLKSKVSAKLASSPSAAPAAPTPAAPALTSAAATFNEKSAGLEPPIATHPEG